MQLKRKSFFSLSGSHLPTDHIYQQFLLPDHIYQRERNSFTRVFFTCCEKFFVPPVPAIDLMSLQVDWFIAHCAVSVFIEKAKTDINGSETANGCNLFRLWIHYMLSSGFRWNSKIRYWLIYAVTNEFETPNRHKSKMFIVSCKRWKQKVFVMFNNSNINRSEVHQVRPISGTKSTQSQYMNIWTTLL